MLKRGLKPRRTPPSTSRDSRKSRPVSRRRFHRLFPCRFWAPSNTIAVIFSIRTAIFQPLVFFSSLARFLQAVVEGGSRSACRRRLAGLPAGRYRDPPHTAP